MHYRRYRAGATSAARRGQQGAALIVAMLVFLLLLVEGLVWAWKKGVLSWT